ncbi:3351_t:CDS:2 [Diversispora eburnea]|uniref:3351_t:CDS:1 n=1 Tax=Diversispora eburnea TaxID=1213867 RepID=A0A9N9G3N9_9GLOM|nr:3351_t:CDS:2 [Diversispora eburnea]
MVKAFWFTGYKGVYYYDGHERSDVLEYRQYSMLMLALKPLETDINLFVKKEGLKWNGVRWSNTVNASSRWSTKRYSFNFGRMWIVA